MVLDRYAHCSSLGHPAGVQSDCGFFRSDVNFCGAREEEASLIALVTLSYVDQSFMMWQHDLDSDLAVVIIPFS